MEEKNYEQMWQILKALVNTFEGYSIDLEQISTFMDEVESALRQ